MTVASALAGVALPRVHAAGSDLIQVALIGCGGRGTGAADNALSTVKQGPIKLVAMADVFEGKLNRSVESLKQKFADQFDVPGRPAGSSASTATRRPWIASSPATSPSSPRRPRSAGSTSPTPSRRA